MGYTEEQLKYLVENTQIRTPTDRNTKGGDFLFNLKGKHREAMFAGVQIANAKIEKQVEVAAKNKTHAKRGAFLKKLAYERDAAFKAVEEKITKKLENWMASEGLEEIEGLYTKVQGDIPRSIYWYGLDKFKREGDCRYITHNTFLAKELFEIQQEAYKSLRELRAALLAIQETGHAKPKAVNFPEPIKAELQKFENRGLLPANV